MNHATLCQRWHSSTNCLANELYTRFQDDQSQSDSKPSSPLPLPFDDGTILSDVNAISSFSNKWLTTIELYYNEPHRAYHNMSHVADVLKSLDVLLPNTNHDHEASVSVKGIAITTLAAFFHDVIYNPKSSTNEKDSADLFLEFASELAGVIASSLGNTTEKEQSSSANVIKIQSHDMVSQIEQCIIATATHISSANEARKSNNTLTAVFLDADMSILGRDTERYDKYAGCIRKEYKFVERNVYCEKRAEILESFLPLVDVDDAMPYNDDEATTPGSAKSTEKDKKKQHLYIYATEKGRELWEDQARQNLRREIDMLRRGAIPFEK